MRTTLTLDDDVAKAIETLRRESGASLKEIVNEAIRRGLEPPEQPSRKPFRTASASPGRCLIASVDDIADVLATIEGELGR